MDVWPEKLKSLVILIMVSAYFIITSVLWCISEANLASTTFFKLPLVKDKQKFPMHEIDTYISEISNKINIPRFSVFKNDEHWNKQLWFQW